MLKGDERRQGSASPQGEALTVWNAAPINTKKLKYSIAYVNDQNLNSNYILANISIEKQKNRLYILKV